MDGYMRPGTYLMRNEMDDCGAGLLLNHGGVGRQGIPANPFASPPVSGNPFDNKWTSGNYSSTYPEIRSWECVQSWAKTEFYTQSASPYFPVNMNPDGGSPYNIPIDINSTGGAIRVLATVLVEQGGPLEMNWLFPKPLT